MAIVKRLYPAALQFQPRLVEVAGRVAIGATGAVGTQTGKGFTVTRTGAGLYTITVSALQGTANKVGDILKASVDVGFATGTATLTAKVLTISAATGTVTIQTATAAAPNTAADPTSGAFLMIEVLVQNTSQTQ